MAQAHLMLQLFLEWISVSNPIPIPPLRRRPRHLQ